MTDLAVLPANGSFVPDYGVRRVDARYFVKNGSLLVFCGLGDRRPGRCREDKLEPKYSQKLGMKPLERWAEIVSEFLDLLRLDAIGIAHHGSMSAGIADFLKAEPVAA